MVRDGIYYAVGLVVVSYILFRLTGSSWIAAIPVLLALFFLWFFRDPPRRIPGNANEFVSPADGKVTEADWIETPQGSRLRLSIFLNGFDVHVNRTPISGTVTQVNYKKGMFLNAMRADSNVLNEQNVVVIEDGEYSVQVKQIAGLLARRIVCWVKPGDVLQKGQRFGLIKFGSRVDILLPPHANLRVQKGDRVRGGSSVIAMVPTPTGAAPVATPPATVAGV